MAHIGICSKDTRLGIALAKNLKALGREKISIKHVCNGESYDAVLIGTPPPTPHPHFFTDILIVPDCIDVTSLSSELAGSVISYGLRRKNTITASSLVDTRLVLSLQRAIPTVCGDVINEQEIPINVSRAEQSDEILGLAAALLTVGVSTDELSSLTFSL